MSRRTLAILGILVALAGVVAFGALYTVHQTQQGLVMQFGKIQSVVSTPGLKVKVPFVQDVIYVDKRILAYDAPAEEIIASDQKRLVVDSFLRFRISDPLRFYQSVRTEATARSRINAILSSVLRRVLGGVPLATLLTKERSKLMRQITNLSNLETSNLGIKVIDVRVKRADLPEANSQAIYARMKSEREREAREFRAQGAEISQRIRARADREKTVLIAEAQKRAQITRGQGDGKAVRIFAQAFGKDPEFFNFYRTMEAYRESLSGDDTTLVLSPDSEFFSFIRSVTGKPGPAPEGQ